MGENYVAHPHDSLVRNILSEIDLAADLLQNYLEPKWGKALEWDSLKREPGDAVAPNLSARLGDLRYSARFKNCDEELKVLVMLEHQSRPDRFMSFRMLEYICAVYRERLPLLKKGMRFPYPLTVVLHHGETPWKKIPSMRELIAMTPDVEGDILQLPIHLIDLPAMPVDQLRGHPMVCALLDSLQSASAGVLPSRMESIFARLISLGGERRMQSWEMALAKYYIAVRGEVRSAVDEITRILTGLHGKREAGKMAMTMYEQIQREGLDKGRAEGKIESMLTVLESRFGEVPAGIQKKLTNLRDVGRIEQILRLAVTSQNLKEFQNAL